jgi:hypothetical protein
MDSGHSIILIQLYVLYNNIVLYARHGGKNALESTALASSDELIYKL